MRTCLVALAAALVAAGCAARLPTSTETARRVPVVTEASFMTPVSAERLSRVVVPVSEHQAASTEFYEGPEEEMEFLRNELTVFLGNTFERGSGGFTVGLDYSRWLHERFGVSVFSEYVAGEIDAVVFGAAVLIRPVRRYKDLTFTVGMGVDLTHAEQEEGEDCGCAEQAWEADFMVRLGVGYGFDLPHGLRLIPAFYWDLVSAKAQAYVFGLHFGKEF